jgi:NADH:ubiquinone reductase (H+-translocating)
VILGAGFAGVGVAHELRRQCSPSQCEIVIIDENNFSLYTPMLAEAAGGAVDAPDIVAPIRSLAHRITFEQARIDGIDGPNRSATITVGDNTLGIPEVTRTVSGDHLVVALGSVTNFRNIPGLEENSLTAKTVEDAITIRNRALALLERADEEPDTGRRRDLLTFVVGGGGFSGVETIAAVNDMLRELTEYYPNVQRDDIRMMLVHPLDRILPEIGEKLAGYAQRELEKRGVEIHLNTGLTAAGPEWVEIKGPGETESKRITAYTNVWTGGVMPSPVVGKSGLPLGKHGGISVDSTCAVAHHPGVWALGDCAEIPQPRGGGFYAPTAQNAIREGKQVGRNIAQVMRGGQAEPFDYTPVGELAIVGRHSGVASIYGRHISGLPAWAMWRAIYLAKLPRMSQRIRVGFDWTIDGLFGRDIAELPGVGPANAPGGPTRR